MNFWRIRSLAVTASTNDDAKAAAEAGEAEGLVVTAAKQTAGRGRHGRAWESPEGNLHCSVLLRPKDLPKNAGLYSFVAALAVRDAVAEWLEAERISSPLGGRIKVGGSNPDDPPSQTLPPKGGRALSPLAITLKWPNDVLVNGKKIAGLLLEAGADWLVIGIGLNVAHHPKDALYPATSLAADGAEATVPDSLDRLLNRLKHWHDLMQKDGFAPVREAWLAHAEKGRLTVRLPRETVTGDFAGLDADGRLRLRLADGTERVIATGDVFPPLKD